MNQHTKRAARALLTASISIAVAGCDQPGDSFDESSVLGDTDDSEYRIENGTSAPYAVGGAGVVHYWVWAADGAGNWVWHDTCSGQIIARNAILSAAHCFRPHGFNGTMHNVTIFANMQIHNEGSWVNVTEDGANTWREATVHIHPNYTGQFVNGAWQNITPGFDAAVIIFNDDLSHVTQTMAADIAQSSAGPEVAWAYGYGWQTDTVRNIGLRLGVFEDLTWTATMAETTTDPDEAHLCESDSGGPLKTIGSATAGIVWGINSSGSPGNGTHCRRASAEFAAVGSLDTWIAGRMTRACTSRTLDGSLTWNCW